MLYFANWRGKLLKSVKLLWQAGPYGKCWKNSSLDYNCLDGQKFCPLFIYGVCMAHNAWDSVQDLLSKDSKQNWNGTILSLSEEPIIFYFILLIGSVSLIPEYIMCTHRFMIWKKKKTKPKNGYVLYLWSCRWNCLVDALLPSDWASGCHGDIWAWESARLWSMMVQVQVLEPEWLGLNSAL